MVTSDSNSRFIARPAFLSDLEATARVMEVPTSCGLVRWRAFGEGPPLLMLHGGRGSWLHWIRNIGPLARTHQLWVPDMPGFGESCDLDESGSTQAPLQRLTLALKESLDRLVGDRASVDVVGFSFGALVAAQLWRQRGGFRSLVLLGPAGHGTSWRREVKLPSWRDSGPDSRRERLVEILSAFMIHDPCSIDTAALYAQESSSLRARYHYRNVARASSLGDLLRDCTAPVLFAWGEQDATGVAERAGPHLVGDAPNRKWCIIPRAAHWVQFERADYVNAQVAEWCATAGPLVS
jgi:2-hydroxy-6-oxonona-2,4-dienedioate hydrolase